MELFDQINTPIATTIVGACLAALFGYAKYIKRDRLTLSYTKTESDFFPLGEGQGKYYAINIANNGGRLIKNIVAELDISDSSLESVTSHDLISNIERLGNKVKIHIPNLNPKEDISVVITSKVNRESKASVKLRAEGVNGEERKVNLSGWDISAVASLAGIAGFFGAILYITVRMPIEGDVNNKTAEIYTKFRESGLSSVFYKMVQNHDEISYEYSAYYLLAEYVKNPGDLSKYDRVLNALGETDGVQSNSVSTIYYVLYKIQKYEGNQEKAKVNMEKCRNASKETYKILVEQDINESIDLVPK